eukprot:4318064-Pleurochrysis_carterae.AAC.2
MRLVETRFGAESFSCAASTPLMRCVHAVPLVCAREGGRANEAEPRASRLTRAFVRALLSAACSLLPSGIVEHARRGHSWHAGATLPTQRQRRVSPFLRALF